MGNVHTVGVRKCDSLLVPRVRMPHDTHAGVGGQDALDAPRGLGRTVRDDDHPRVQAHYEEIVAQVNNNLARFERLKKVLIIPEELSIEDGTLTPSLKLRRRNVEARYHDQIEKLYADAAPADSAPTA